MRIRPGMYRSRDSGQLVRVFSSLGHQFCQDVSETGRPRSGTMRLQKWFRDAHDWVREDDPRPETDDA